MRVAVEQKTVLLLGTYLEIIDSFERTKRKKIPHGCVLSDKLLS